MGKAIVYAQSMDPSFLASSLAGHEVRRVASRAELASVLVNEPDVLCAIMQLDTWDAGFAAFMSSLKRSMARLAVAVVCDTCPQNLPELYVRIPANQDRAALAREIGAFVASAEAGERRRARRFEWPLEGYFSRDGEHWTFHRVRSLSAYGAFLESSDPAPDPGTRGKLRVVFQGFKMLTGCEVLDSRRSSSNLPAGFAVRFLGFSEAGRELIERIVNDALVRSLLEPLGEQGTPSLGEELLAPGTEIT